MCHLEEIRNTEEKIECKLHPLENHTGKNIGKSVFSSLKYYKSVTFIPHVSFGANQPFN